MIDHEPLTIEILGRDSGATPVVLDRVMGGTCYLHEAKRIGRHLLSITEGDASPVGFRILGPAYQVLYVWHVGDDEAT
ncbi:MAG TPA: hypothetical protein VE999_21465 [Gemmataceae bacterium]|nr:hypothetical protein [Gemmataceae bacterium]